MISTVSFSFDLTYVNPQGVPTPRCVITDSTDYASLAIDLMQLEAKGYGVLTFNGEVVQANNIPGNPLIDLELGQTVAYINLPLDRNNNVANGTYSFQYSLRLNSAAPTIVGTGINNTLTLPFPFNGFGDYLVPGNVIELIPFLVPGPTISNVVTSASNSGTSATIGLQTAVSSTLTGYGVSLINVVNEQFNETYSYSGCTLATADVDFVYDCEYGDSGTWSVSNATDLGPNEIVNSLVCTINYPSWTTSNPLFNPQVVTTALPYPTYPSPNPPVSTPLATGTYTVSLLQQIQQTQDSGLVITYNRPVTKEFTVTCAGTLCGLVPCIENLRAAHAAELVRNRISKYQVFVDNVSLYYMEAMNYRACGELDKYKSTIDLLQAQLDASGCDCACCDDESYYWVSNNSANSIIDELLANFQYRLYSGGGDSPGDIQPGVEFGAIWQDVDTGIFYRCTDATAGALQWEVYYDPSIFHPTGADNGLSISAEKVVLGGALDNDTFIDLNGQNLSFSDGNVLFSGTGSQKVTLSSSNSALQVNGGASALIVEGSTNALNVTANTSVAAFLEVNRAVNNNVATALSLRTTVDSGTGDDGIGTSIQFASESSSGAPSTTASIESVLVSATTPVQANLNFKTRSNSNSTLLDRLTLNPDGSATLHSYGDGTFAGSPEYYLGVDVDGNVIESNPVSSASNGLSVSGSDVVLGGTLSGNTTIDLNTRNLTLSGTTGDVEISATTGTALNVSSGTSSALTVDASSNAIIATSTSDVAAVLRVDKTTNNTVSRNVILRTTVDGGVGAAGLGSSIAFQGENNAGATFDMAEIKTTMTNAASGVSKFDFTLKDLRGSSLVPAMTINGDFSLNLSEYGSGTFTGTATHSLSVDASGNVIETAPAPKVYLALVTQSGTGNPTVTVIQNTTGETVTWDYVDVGTYNAVITNGIFASGKTAVTASLGGYAPVSPYVGELVSVAGQRLSSTVVQLLSFGAEVRIGTQTTGLSNSVLYNATVRIEIYP